MSLPFDATLKELVRRYPLDWLAGLDLDAQLPVRALDVNLSTVSAEADTVLGIGDPLSSLVQIEFQSSRDVSLARRLLVYGGVGTVCNLVKSLRNVQEFVGPTGTQADLLHRPVTAYRTSRLRRGGSCPRSTCAMI